VGAEEDYVLIQGWLLHLRPTKVGCSEVGFLFLPHGHYYLPYLRESESNSSSSKNSFCSETLTAGISGIISRGSWISIIVKSIKSSTECTKTSSRVLSTDLLCFFL
jgi:hypothetical protein